MIVHLAFFGNHLKSSKAQERFSNDLREKETEGRCEGWELLVLLLLLLLGVGGEGERLSHGKMGIWEYGNMGKWGNGNMAWSWSHGEDFLEIWIRYNG